MAQRKSFYDAKMYGPVQKAASTVDRSVRRQAIAGPYKAMSPLDKSIATGVPLKSKNKNPGKYLDK